jgi:hypothetical protein
MKYFLRAAALLSVLAFFAKADTLRLRDGTVIVGSYVGGSQTEIYFQRSPAGAEAFPLFAVESLRFGNLIGSSAPSLPTPSVLKATKAKFTMVKLLRRSARPVAAAAPVEEQKPLTLATLFTKSISGRLSP